MKQPIKVQFNLESSQNGIRLEVIAQPAPRTLRPLANIINPYPYGCSVLCNHPRDPELRDVVWRSGLPAHDQAKLAKESKGLLINDGFSFPVRENRLVSISNSSKPARSASAEGRYSGHKILYQQRPWKSTSDLTYSPTGKSEQVWGHQERFELTSPRTNSDKLLPPRSIRRQDIAPSSKSSKEAKKVSGLKRSTSKAKGQIAPNSNLLATSNIGGSALVSDYETDESEDRNGKETNSTISIKEIKDVQEERPPSTGKVNREELDTTFNVENDGPVEETNDISNEIEMGYLEEIIQKVDIQSLKKSLDSNQGIRNLLEETSWLHFPRAGDTFGARFELPIDFRLLRGKLNMSPLEYLSRYVVASRCRQRLNGVVFQRYASPDLSPDKLMAAMAEILGFRLSEEAEQLLLNLTDMKDAENLNYMQFCGIGALAERIGREGISHRDDLEIVDFNLLKQRFSYIDTNPKLCQLLTFICR